MDEQEIQAEIDRRVKADIQVHGWHVAKIEGDEHVPPWAHTAAGSVKSTSAQSTAARHVRRRRAGRGGPTIRDRNGGRPSGYREVLAW